MPVPRALATATEAGAVPTGSGERFAGYGVMGLPFRSGHVLAMRRFAASSVGPAYTSVWHRDPAGDWVFWQDGRAEHSCARYFSAALSGSRTVGIELAWPTDTTLRIAIPEVELAWTATFRATAATRVLSGAGRVMPDRAWRSPAVLRAMAPLAGRMLGAGRLGMVGTVPNGQSFIANPQRVFAVASAEAHLGGQSLGPPGALDEQARLGDFWIPQCGVLAFGRAFFETP